MGGNHFNLVIQFSLLRHTHGKCSHDFELDAVISNQALISMKYFVSSLFDYELVSESNSIR